MTNGAFSHFVRTVKDATDLAELIRERVELTGSSTLKGRSPVNQDSNPSLVVRTATQTWRDWSGGGSHGGDCIDWIRYVEGCGFWDALTKLAARAGVRRPDVDPETFNQQRAIAEERREVQRVLGLAAAYYHRRLTPEDRAARFYDHYGFEDEVVDTLQLGWADGGLWHHLTQECGVTPELALKTGLFTLGKDGVARDFFRNRLTFPYWAEGRVVYFAARGTERCGDYDLPACKYLKLLTRSEERPHISETVTNSYFFNEDGAKGAETLLIAEGITDCISAVQAGFHVISPATTSFSAATMPKLLKLAAKAEKVVICFDAEENRSGAKGAEAIAEKLFDAGVDIRIAELPRPEGLSKIDLNEYIKRHGKERTETLVAGASRWPEYLLHQVPQTTPELELNAKLESVFRALTHVPEIDRDIYIRRVAERFGLKPASIKAAIKEAAKAEPKDENDDPPDWMVEGGPSPDEQNRRRLKGEVCESSDAYTTVDDRGNVVGISSFVIRPTLRLVTPTAEVIEADVHTDAGTVLHGIRFPRGCWNSSSAFMKVLPDMNLQWTGSDENVQGVLRLVAASPMQTRQGTENLGLHDSKEGACWVTPDTVLDATGQSARTDPVVYLPKGCALAGRIRYSERSAADTRRLAGRTLPLLLDLNTAEVVLPALGWFFASLVRPRIARKLGQFPILCVWGTQGSGKSSLVTEALWPLVGVQSPEPFSATETEWPMIRLLASTDSVPVVIDEYKPYDMRIDARDRLHRLLRRSYRGETEERGKADLTTVAFRLTAPVCLIGETRPTESALVERMVAVNPDKNCLTQSPQMQVAFKALRSLGHGALAASIVRFACAHDTETCLAAAQLEIEALLAERVVPIRVRENLAVVLTGVAMFREYAESQGVSLPDFDLKPVIGAMLDDLLEAGGRTVKSTLDQFLEHLSVMAIRHKLHHTHEFQVIDGVIHLHFPSCHSAFTQYCRETGYRNEIPDAKSLRAQIRENHRAHGYVKAPDALTCGWYVGNIRRRAVTIDYAKASQTLDIDGLAYCGLARVGDAEPVAEDNQ